MLIKVLFFVLDKKKKHVKHNATPNPTPYTPMVEYRLNIRNKDTMSIQLSPLAKQPLSPVVYPSKQILSTPLSSVGFLCRII